MLLQGIGGVGGGKCYFVDSQASNNWIAHRVRNSTHNYVYAESYGKQAMHAPTPVRPFCLLAAGESTVLAGRAATITQPSHSCVSKRCADNDNRCVQGDPRGMGIFKCLCASLSPLPLIVSYKSEKSLCGTETATIASASCTTTGRSPPITLTSL